MSKKSVFTLVVFLILGVVVTYVVAIWDALRRSSLFGEGGVPFRFTSGATLLGGASTDYFMLLINIIFWSVVLWVIWKMFLKLLGK